MLAHDTIDTCATHAGFDHDVTDTDRQTQLKWQRLTTAMFSSLSNVNYWQTKPAIERVL